MRIPFAKIDGYYSLKKLTITTTTTTKSLFTNET